MWSVCYRKKIIANQEYGVSEQLLFMHSLSACMGVHMFVQDFSMGQPATTTVFLQRTPRAATNTAICSVIAAEQQDAQL